ncbi:MAG: SUMF1/EgtB/PvdO family nonheme iron enzyme [Desulfamplus sp.]|nr:SUMF1/EgtB/PvdO family nonheme iron enzyme [Desulfamplus sp.]
MANGSISLKGVDKAIASLNYKDSSVKKRAVLAIREYYSSDDAVSQLKSINTDELIKIIWDIGDDVSKIKSKKRNFYSIISSINSDLANLSPETENPDKLTITSENIFDMTEDAKNSLLNSFSEVARNANLDLNQITDVLKSITEMISKIEIEAGAENTKFSDTLEQIKNRLLSISDSVLEEQVQDGDEIIEEISKDDVVEEVEEIEDVEDIEELDEDVEVIDADNEEIEDVEDIEELDEDVEVIDADDEEIEDVEDIEELDDDEEIFEDVQEITDEDDMFEEVDIDDSQEILMDDNELEDFKEFQKNKELARQFDNLLADADKKYNIYVVIPAGIYTVGSISKTKNRLELQQIEMQKLYIAKYPVTNSLFEIFIQETGYVTTAEKKRYGTVFYGRFRKDTKNSAWRQGIQNADVKGACWYQPEGPGSSLHNKRNHPVVQVSVDDAWAFASWIGRRLPTESEWEATARTDMAFKYPWGNEWQDNSCNIEKSSISDTTPVDKYEHKSNIFNITDMLGNAMEWTSDIISNPFLENNKQSMLSQNNNLSSNSRSNDKNRFHVAKGCGWTARDNITISSRSLFKAQYTSNIVGFRCVSEYLL